MLDVAGRREDLERVTVSSAGADPLLLPLIQTAPYLKTSRNDIVSVVGEFYLSV